MLSARQQRKLKTPYLLPTTPTPPRKRGKKHAAKPITPSSSSTTGSSKKKGKRATKSLVGSTESSLLTPPPSIHNSGGAGQSAYDERAAAEALASLSGGAAPYAVQGPPFYAPTSPSPFRTSTTTGELRRYDEFYPVAGKAMASELDGSVIIPVKLKNVETRSMVKDIRQTKELMKVASRNYQQAQLAFVRSIMSVPTNGPPFFLYPAKSAASPAGPSIAFEHGLQLVNVPELDTCDRIVNPRGPGIVQVQAWVGLSRLVLKSSAFIDLPMVHQSHDIIGFGHTPQGTYFEITVEDWNTYQKTFGVTQAELFGRRQDEDKLNALHVDSVGPWRHLITHEGCESDSLPPVGYWHYGPRCRVERWGHVGWFNTGFLQWEGDRPRQWGVHPISNTFVKLYDKESLSLWAPECSVIHLPF